MAVLTAAVDGEGAVIPSPMLCRSVSHHRSNRQQPDLCRCPFGYSLWTLKEVTGGFHVVSVNAKYNGNAQALEVYNSLFTTFSEKDNDYYLFNLYKLTDERPTVAGGLPEEGAQVVIFNQSAQGVLSTQDDNADNPSIQNARGHGGRGRRHGGQRRTGVHRGEKRGILPVCQ